MVAKGNEDKVSATMAERGFVLMLGIIPFRVKPLTLMQIIEIGEHALALKGIDTKSEDNQFTASLKVAEQDGGAMLDICEVAVFRKRWQRRIFGGMLRKRMDSKTYEKVVGWIYSTFDFSFFLTSSLFMAGLKQERKSKEEE